MAATNPYPLQQKHFLNSHLFQECLEEFFHIVFVKGRLSISQQKVLRTTRAGPLTAGDRILSFYTASAIPERPRVKG